MAYVINDNLFDVPINSYTSNSEFNADYRVQYNNEVPPVDLLPLLIRPMRKDPLWQW
jgi:hypothetical protein